MLVERIQLEFLESPSEHLKILWNVTIGFGSGISDRFREHNDVVSI